MTAEAEQFCVKLENLFKRLLISYTIIMLICTTLGTIKILVDVIVNSNLVVTFLIS